MSNPHLQVPLEQRFWDFLLGKSKAWGLATYEQDWLYNELNGVPVLTQNATMGREWLMQMGRAAQKHNLTVQYCMAYPRHALQVRGRKSHEESFLYSPTASFGGPFPILLALP